MLCDMRACILYVCLDDDDDDDDDVHVYMRVSAYVRICMRERLVQNCRYKNNLP